MSGNGERKDGNTQFLLGLKRDLFTDMINSWQHMETSDDWKSEHLYRMNCAKLMHEAICRELELTVISECPEELKELLDQAHELIIKYCQGTADEAVLRPMEMLLVLIDQARLLAE